MDATPDIVVISSPRRVIRSRRTQPSITPILIPLARFRITLRSTLRVLRVTRLPNYQLALRARFLAPRNVGKSILEDCWAEAHLCFFNQIFYKKILFDFGLSWMKSGPPRVHQESPLDVSYSLFLHPCLRCRDNDCLHKQPKLSSDSRSLPRMI